MKPTKIVSGLWQIQLGFAHAFLLDTGDGLAVIDTGVAGSAETIVKAADQVPRVRDGHNAPIRHILLTRCHSDHAGSAAELHRRTGAPVTMHPIDAALTRKGEALRPLSRAPGLMNWIIVRAMKGKAPTTVEPVEVDVEANDGDILPGDLRAIHVPGHCAGQLAFLWPEHGGVLIAADAAARVFGLALSPMYEDLEEGRRSLAKLAALKFNVAVFGHGKPLRDAASTKFRAKWAAHVSESSVG